MEDINYVYCSGALEALLSSLSLVNEFEAMSYSDKRKYIDKHTKRYEETAID